MDENKVNQSDVHDISDELLELVKENLRIIASDEDKLLAAMIRTAKRVVKNAVGPDDEFYVNNDSYLIAILQMATNYYLNRSASTDVNLYDTDHGYSELILDMKADYALWEQTKNGTIS